MIHQKKVLAIIPARGGSKGLPGKNGRMLHGLPLLAWPIQAALASKYVDRVVVSTDDAHLASLAREHGAEVPFMRPAHLAADTSPSSDAILHAIDACTQEDGVYDYVLVLEPTSPLTDAQDIDTALMTLDASDARAIVGVSRVTGSHPDYCVSIDANQCIKPLLRDSFMSPTRRQDMSDVYCFDGSLYISDVKTYQETATFYHNATLPYIVPHWKSLEIDSLFDFLMVETVMTHKHLFASDATS
jgi:N-acylneuraminate cytidylyltransferase/CMP-N,N'-diacetyllegionaminic acid synthase